MKARMILLAALVAVMALALPAAASTAPPTAQSLLPQLCVDKISNPAVFDQYGYYDGRTVSQMIHILIVGDPNGAVVRGVWTQQLPPGEFADYNGGDPYAPGAYTFHYVQFGVCQFLRFWPTLPL